MADPIESVLARGGGVATRGRLVAALGRPRADAALRRGQLVPVFPRTYVRPWDVDQLDTRENAAVLSVGPPALLSHVSALRRFGLPTPPTEYIHVTTVASRRLQCRSEELIVHRAKVLSPNTVIRRLPTACVATAVVTSWPLLPAGTERRAPAIVAVRRRIVRPAELRGALGVVRVRGRADLTELITMLEAGCDSELELWGYTRVFDVPGLRHGRRQCELSVDGGTFRLDLGYEEEQVAIELDGRRYHAGPDQWERDIARDLKLARIGWQTVRLSHRRLTTDVDGCRRDVLAVLRSRRQRRQ